MALIHESLDLNDVRAFVVAAQAGSLSGAAKELGLPTSTVSRAMTRLEKHLGLLLVRRGQRGLLLTDAGNQYLESCRAALRTLQDGSDHLEQHRSRPRGVLKISSPVTMARNVLIPLVGKFLEVHPELRVDIEPYTSCEQEPNEDIDVFFQVRAPKDSLKRVRNFPGTKRALYASTSYARKYGVPSDPSELFNHRCIGSPDPYSSKWRLTNEERTVSLDLDFQVTVLDTGMRRQLVQDGAGISILPVWMTKDPAIVSEFEQLLPTWLPSPISLCALYSGALKMTPKVQMFLDFMAIYLGTDLDPRLHGSKASECFVSPRECGSRESERDSAS